jgi:CubicO group peptidase (beta-lactamase class C family)/sugar lactone lactonase YvrE
VAWVTAIRHPERVISLTVISTPHVRALAETLADTSSDQAARSAYMQDFAAAGSEDRFLADGASRLRGLFERSGLKPEEIRVYIDALGTKEALRAALDWYRASALSRGRPSRGSGSSSPAPQIGIPTLYVWGTDDKAFGRRAAEATARYVAGPYRFLPFEGVGHWVMEEAPERLNPLLREHLVRWRSGGPPETKDPGPNELEAVLDRFAGLGYSGAVLVARGSTVLVERAFGFADRERKVPNRVDTRFELMSITKLFVALSLLVLESEGKLSIGAPLAEYLGPFPEDKRELTVHDLMLHTAGFPSRGTHLDKTSSSAFVRAIKDAPLETTPGGEVRYSNPGYALGAILVEEVSGQPFRDYLREHVFRRAGMTQTDFTGEGAGAVGYAGPLATPKEVPAPEPGLGVLGATGIVSTVRDLFRWKQALEEGILLPEDTLDKFLREHREGHGYGWVIDSTAVGRLRLQKDGSWPSYESLFVWYPEEDHLVILLSNHNLGLNQQLLKAIEAVLFDKRPKSQRPTEIVSAPRVTTVPLSRELPSRGRLGGVSIGPRGSIYVSNFGATVWKVSPEGEVVTVISSLQGSSGNTIDAEGNLLQASFLDGRIVRMTPDGHMATFVEGGLDGPVGIVADDDGDLYVCNCRSNSVARVDHQGVVTTLAKSDLFECPNGITLGPDGQLYVVSFDNGHVVRVTKQGSVSRIATLPEGGNAHIAFAQGAFFVTKIGTNRVYRLFPGGRYEPFAGTGNLGLEDGPLSEAALSRPNGIAASPDERALYLNNLDGPWRGDEETAIVLRRIELVGKKP